MPDRIICVGDINMDILIEVSHPPRTGETINAYRVSFISGGKGYNQALAAKRLGGNVIFACKIGDDAFGNALKQTLEEENLETNMVISKGSLSGMAIVMVDKDAQNYITVNPGSNYELDEKELHLDLKKSDIVLSQSAIPLTTVESVFKTAKKAGATTILNTSRVDIEIKKLFGFADYIIMNEVEAAGIAGDVGMSSDKETLLRQIKKLRANKAQTIIITLGPKGLVCSKGSEYMEIPGIKVKAVDTSGAGDCFLGAFSVALSEGKPLREALIFANAAAAVSVQRKGTSTSFPNRKDVMKLMSGN